MEVDGGRHLSPPLLLDASTSGSGGPVGGVSPAVPYAEVAFSFSATSIKHFAKTRKENNGMRNKNKKPESRDRTG